MALDAYSPCLCGSGKKLKFCCADLTAELDKAIALLQGDQNQAALEYLDQVLVKHPGRAALMSLRESALLRLGRYDLARESAAEFVRLHPTNIVALANSAVHEVQNAEPRQAIRLLNSAFEHADGKISSNVMTVLPLFVRVLLMRGYPLAAQAHLLLSMALNPQEKTTNELFTQFCKEERIPLLLKEDRNLTSAPEGAPFADELEQILSQWRRVQWVSAEEMLTPLAERYSDSALLWRNLATLRGMIADHEGMCAALKQLAKLDVTQDDAIEALATAQLLNGPDEGEVIYRERVVIPITDFERATAALDSNTRSFEIPAEEVEWQDEDPATGATAETHLPPPKRAYLLLDRPMPATGVGMAVEAMPEVLAEAFLFGRETDREPRLEVRVDQDLRGQAETLLREIAGDAVGASGEARQLGGMPQDRRALLPQVIPPADTPREDLSRLVESRKRDVLLNRWTQLSFASLDNKTPTEAAKDPALHNALLAEILLLDLTVPMATGDIEQLRLHLGLPEPTPVVADPEAIADVPLVRLGRVSLEGLSFDDLDELWQRFDHYRVRTGAERVGLALLAQMRPEEDSEMIEEMYGSMATLATDADKTLDYLRKARDEANRAGRSSAMWDLDELQTVLRRNDLEAGMQIIQHIQTSHAREPGVMQAMMQMLQQMGLVRPDQMPMPGQLPGGSAAGMGGPSIVPAGAPAGGGGKLWTPGSDNPAPAAGKSAIWTPGS